MGEPRTNAKCVTCSEYDLVAKAIEVIDERRIEAEYRFQQRSLECERLQARLAAQEPVVRAAMAQAEEWERAESEAEDPYDAADAKAVEGLRP